MSSPLQIAGALDAFFAYDGPLGCDARPDGVTLRVWAPTARTVRLLLWDGPYGGAPFEVDMRAGDPAPGVWTATGPSSWVRFCVFVPGPTHQPPQRC